MARGNTIRVSTVPYGSFMEGTISTASFPGTLMEIIPNTAFTNDRPSFRPRSQVAGAAGQTWVLLDDPYQGFLPGTAYTAGTRGFLYNPLSGEEINVLVANGPGTNNPVTQGDLFAVLSNGKLYHVSVGGATSIPFQSMETLPALSADTLVWCVKL